MSPGYTLACCTPVFQAALFVECAYWYQPQSPNRECWQRNRKAVRIEVKRATGGLSWFDSSSLHNLAYDKIKRSPFCTEVRSLLGTLSFAFGLTWIRLSRFHYAISMNARARSRTVQLIVNGKVAGNDALRIAVVGQQEVGHRIEVRVTREKGDAQRFASEAGELDLLIGAGGDGTLNEVVHGLMDLPKEARPVFGVVPLGTANDFATGCGIPRDPGMALALCLEGAAVPIDVGKANEHWFLNVASAGFGAEVTATTSPELKRLLGPAAYTVMGTILAMNVHHYHGRLILPGREITGSGPVAIVGNGRQTGGSFQVAPRARIDDGLLDVLVVRHIPATAALAAARELQQLSPDGEYISYWQTPWAEVHSEETIPVNLDGEPVRFSSVRYEAVPKAIHLIVPPDCPLLSATAK